MELHHPGLPFVEFIEAVLQAFLQRVFGACHSQSLSRLRCRIGVSSKNARNRIHRPPATGSWRRGQISPPQRSTEGRRHVVEGLSSRLSGGRCFGSRRVAAAGMPCAFRSPQWRSRRRPAVLGFLDAGTGLAAATGSEPWPFNRPLLQRARRQGGTARADTTGTNRAVAGHRPTGSLPPGAREHV